MTADIINDCVPYTARNTINRHNQMPNITVSLLPVEL